MRNTYLCGKPPVIRISLSYIYKLAVALEPIGNFAAQETARGDVFFPALLAQNAVTELTTGTLYAPFLRTSFQSAQNLIAELSKITGQPVNDIPIPQYEMFLLKQAYDQYKTVLLADLETLHSYFVSQ
ncbi:MAG: hypothetical protein ACTHLP_06475, partial [Rhizobiaceae bacterium]